MHFFLVFRLLSFEEKHIFACNKKCTRILNIVYFRMYYLACIKIQNTEMYLRPSQVFMKEIFKNFL